MVIKTKNIGEGKVGYKGKNLGKCISEILFIGKHHLKVVYRKV